MSVDDGLRALFRSHLKKVHWTTVETGMVQRGAPDLYGADGATFWVECKSVRRGWAVRFQPAQIGWLLSHARHGGRSFVAVRRRPIRERADELWMYDGKNARELRDDGLRANVSPLLVERLGPRLWDWGRVLSVLT